MKDDRTYLLHVADAIERIAEYTAAGRDAFLSNRQAQDATIRNLEVIGQAVKNLSAPLKAAHPAIPWKRIAGMRDVLIHHYFGVDLHEVWQVVDQHIPSLANKVRELLDTTSRD